MAMTTTTTSTTTIVPAWCALESEQWADALFAQVWQAYCACRIRKRRTSATQRFELQLFERLVSIVEALQARKWQPSRSVAFVVSQPKHREIHAAPFADRVVHHLLVPPLEACFEPVFIHDSYANRRGKGTHAAVERLQSWLRRGQGPLCYLQLDIANFFNSIVHPLLLAQLEQRLRKCVQRKMLGHSQANFLLWLCEQVVYGTRAQSAQLIGRREDFMRVPVHKRLAHAAPERGLPIGNLTSQFFGNVYLNALDQFVKHRLKAQYYLRYVDDFVLLHRDARQLRVWRGEIERFLQESLQLRLRDEGALKPVSSGIDFLGYVIRTDYRLVRRRVVHQLKQKLRQSQRSLVRRTETGTQLMLQPRERDRLMAYLNSYMGHFSHAQSSRLKQSLWRDSPWLSDLCGLSATGTLENRWKIEPRGLAAQQRWLCEQYPGVWPLLRVGRSWMLGEDQAVQAAAWLNSPLSRPPRSGFTAVLELPAKRKAVLTAELQRRRIPHLWTAEEGRYRDGRRRRVVAGIWRPHQR
jgi:hypothetical protein